MREVLAMMAEGGWGSRLIEVVGNPRMAIVKSDQTHAPRLREDGIEVGGKKLRAVLTSGSIGKLKKRAGQSTKDFGKVPQ